MFRIRRHDRHDAGEPVVDDHEDGHHDIETTIAGMPLAIVSSPRVGPMFSSWSGSGFRLAGRLPDRRMAIRRSTSLSVSPPSRTR